MIEFFFDCSSPWTYLGFHSMRQLSREMNVPVRWRPILVGGIFNTINPSVYASRERPVPAKAAYQRKDIKDWAHHLGIAMHFRPDVFPVNSVKAMRACIALEPEGKLVDFAQAAFEVYWGENQDISQDAVMVRVCERAGVDAGRVFDAIAQPAVKDQLRANTEEVMQRGGFGSPTVFVGGDDMYFGNDRMPLIRAAVERLQARA
ncbi:2-hydroxychromene-2-carboxylate isomerase [Comamonas serinivorans]|uniref:2-hydroxychromene-2-carboxylate isomerase n=1 Tax=Comamonas serinivorans TaxID=1082851 RepID=A0A1Y0EKU5_9BURK|nr:2-hydroxychromene-2-carboxylate isomerase [Comamonas serinivorans]ARU04255.1 2-hydroxychromene-2-carboxylate isomerase [Comamonas serinivorans]